MEQPYLASGVGSCTGTSLGSLVMVSQLPNWPTSCLSLRVNSRSLDSRSSNTIPSFEKQKKQSISIQDGSDRERAILRQLCMVAEARQRNPHQLLQGDSRSECPPVPHWWWWREWGEAGQDQSPPEMTLALTHSPHPPQRQAAALASVSRPLHLCTAHNYTNKECHHCAMVQWVPLNIIPFNKISRL